MPIKRVDYLVVHCSATPATRNIGAKEIRQMHMQQGWADIGYHYVIRRDGTVEKGRTNSTPGAHVQGFNSRSLGICLVGGVKPDGKTAETNFTDAQYAALRHTLANLKHAFPAAEIVGHRDLSPDRNRDGRITPDEWLKECPTFDVKAWFEGHPDNRAHH
ncbi:N-acetylmuramoyl-L-alanine amidase [Caulobacter vibrioides]|uniref:Lysozyme n=1 Tax=Caulobacter phage S2B TaxID=2759120 RepID=A0AAE7SY21_9CAUD|nr:N-acetylmuramoyl-L-alanine amidase [Caulobacter vibrioides]QOC54161.1 lysozyme [Caulobacter phage S2B]QXZ53887.1 N-acetylmuramoyl-L-alanine amidase [Caulobacter vibrioides]